MGKWVKNLNTGNEWHVEDEHAEELLKSEDFEEIEEPEEKKPSKPKKQVKQDEQPQ